MEIKFDQIMIKQSPAESITVEKRGGVFDLDIKSIPSETKTLEAGLTINFTRYCPTISCACQ